jgi:hypothetical protein
MGEKFDTPTGVAGTMPASTAGMPAMQMPDMAAGDKPRTVDKKGNPVDPPPKFNPKTDPVKLRDIAGMDDRGGKRDLDTRVWFEDGGTWAETPDGKRGFFTGSGSGVWVDEQGNLMPPEWKGRF